MTKAVSNTPSDEELFAQARAHMEKYSIAASLDRRLWDATVRLVLKAPVLGECEDCGHTIVTPLKRVA